MHGLGTSFEPKHRCLRHGSEAVCADWSSGRLPGLCSPQDLPGLESQREHLDQPFLSVFKKGRRRVPVRNLGKVVHYAKVQLRFQHSQVRAGPGGGLGPACGLPPGAHTSALLPQDVSDCYLELFPSHLYFQAHGSEGLTFQVREVGRGRRLGGWGGQGGAPEAVATAPGGAQPPAGLWQGLLPLVELSICPMEGSREHAFQITGVWHELSHPGG